MTTEMQQGETPEQQPAPSVTPEAAPVNESPEVAELKKRIKELNSESADRRKKLEAFEKTEADRKAAELSEVDRLKLEADRAKAELIEARKIAIAAKHGLPDLLADRLKGETLEELEADALKLKETLPKPAAAAANINPTNPGAQGAAKETDAERRRRLFGG